MLLTKLVALDGDVCPYLAALMVFALYHAGNVLVIPEDMKLHCLTEEEFNDILKQEAGRSYDNYGMIAQELLGQDAPAKKVSATERTECSKIS